MDLLREFFLPCLWAFLACIGFCILFDVHGRGMLLAAFGGSLGWLVYLICCEVWPDKAVAAFLAGMTISIYAEVMARVRRCPASGYLLIAFFPLVPGLGLYHTMEYYINGDNANFLLSSRETLGIAGGLALGVLLASSLVRMLNGLRSGLKTLRTKGGG